MAHIYRIDNSWCSESILQLVDVGLVCKLGTLPTAVRPSVHMSSRVQAPGKLMGLVRWS